MGNNLPLFGTDAQIIRLVEALFGVQPGNIYLSSFQGYVEANGIDQFADALAPYAGGSVSDLATLVSSNFQIDPALQTSTGDNVLALMNTYITAQLNATPQANWGSKILEIVDQYTNLWNDSLLGSSVSKFNAAVFSSLTYSSNASNTAVNDPDAGVASNLTTGQDNLTGTDANDIFNAFIIDNQNTLQSGDIIDGGQGFDTLFADIGDSQQFAITPQTVNVEKLQVRAESGSFDSNENNMSNGVQIDAERMVGTTWYESNNSRADVTIEDVRILRTDAYGDDSNQITADVTVAMVSTDPGNVDLGVYFDQHSLVKDGDIQATSITLTIGNQVEEADFDETAPLKDVPYDNVGFLVNGQQVVLALDLTNVETYDQLWTVFENAFNAAKASGNYSSLLTDVTLTRSVGTDSFFSRDGVLRHADEFILTINPGEITPSQVGWTATGGLPSNNAFSANVDPGNPIITSPLITSNIVIDDVGRGSMGGDLIVGGMSIGTGDSQGEGTSNSKGVEQFNIKVERSSQLQEIQSTNNTLEEVYIVNGDTKGDLVVKGDTDLGIGGNDLPGSDNNDSGFLDVRVLDASKMEGKVDLNAELSSNVVGKYLDLGDTATNAAADNRGFMYDLGKNDDNLDLLISKENLVAAGTTTREDFYLNINGNSGNDTITTIIGDGSGTIASNWYINSKINANLTVNGDAGDDTIKTTGAGDFNINAGSGNDTVYANNDGIAGGVATWIVNATNTDINDLQSNGVLTDTILYKATMTVTLSGASVAGASGLTGAGVASEYANGFESKVTIGTTNYVGNELSVNQAIKDAINNNDVLNKLLVAKDGPANTLVIESLVDGQFDPQDLSFNITGLTAAEFNALSVSEKSGIQNAYEQLMNDSTAVYTSAMPSADAEALEDLITGVGVDPLGVVESVLATNPGLMDGTPSTSVSDNIINMGSGNDVAVLGTDANSNDTLVFDGTFGDDVIFNFDEAAGTSQDSLDFTAYLGGLQTLPAGSTSVNSQTVIPTVAVAGLVTGAGNNQVEANEVYVVNDFVENTVGGATETWANLTANDLLEAIKATNTAGAKDYGNITEDDFDVGDTNADLVGTTIKNVFMIENDLNKGEYKVFEVTATGGTTDEFSAVSLVGTIDFGAELTAGNLSLI